MRVSPINIYQNRQVQTPYNSRPSFRAVKSLESETKDFDLKTPEGLPVLKAFAENEGIRKFCTENDVDVKFNYCYMPSCHYITSMEIKLLNRKKRDVIRYEVDTGKCYLGQERYDKTVETINSITYEDLVEKSYATKRKEEAKQKKLEEIKKAADEHDRIIKELLNL